MMSKVEDVSKNAVCAVNVNVSPEDMSPIEVTLNTCADANRQTELPLDNTQELLTGVN